MLLNAYFKAFRVNATDILHNVCVCVCVCVQQRVIGIKDDKIGCIEQKRKLHKKGAVVVVVHTVLWFSSFGLHSCSSVFAIN